MTNPRMNEEEVREGYGGLLDFVEKSGEIPRDAKGLLVIGLGLLFDIHLCLQKIAEGK